MCVCVCTCVCVCVCHRYKESFSFFISMVCVYTHTTIIFKRACRHALIPTSTCIPIHRPHSVCVSVVWVEH